MLPFCCFLPNIFPFPWMKPQELCRVDLLPLRQWEFLVHLKLLTLVNFLEICFYISRKQLLELTPKKDVLFFIGDWNAKVKSQEILGVTGKFGLGVQNEAGQRLTVLPREHTGHSKHPLPTTQEKTLHMDITRWSILRLIIFFAAEDGEALYSQQKQDQELTVAQIMNSLLTNSDLSWKK